MRLQVGTPDLGAQYHSDTLYVGLTWLAPGLRFSETPTNITTWVASSSDIHHMHMTPTSSTRWLPIELG